jgi:hypothetical protein
LRSLAMKFAQIFMEAGKEMTDLIQK